MNFLSGTLNVLFVYRADFWVANITNDIFLKGVLNSMPPTSIDDVCFEVGEA